MKYTYYKPKASKNQSYINSELIRAETLCALLCNSSVHIQITSYNGEGTGGSHD